MARVLIKLDRSGIEKLLRSPEVERDIRNRATRIGIAAGAGHSVETYQGADRVRAHVGTETVAAMRAEAEYRNLSSAIDAGRG